MRVLTAGLCSSRLALAACEVHGTSKENVQGSPESESPWKCMVFTSTRSEIVPKTSCLPRTYAAYRLSAKCRRWHRCQQGSGASNQCPPLCNANPNCTASCQEVVYVLLSALGSTLHMARVAGGISGPGMA